MGALSGSRRDYRLAEAYDDHHSPFCRLCNFTGVGDPLGTHNTSAKRVSGYPCDSPPHCSFPLLAKTPYQSACGLPSSLTSQGSRKSPALKRSAAKPCTLAGLLLEINLSTSTAGRGRLLTQADLEQRLPESALSASDLDPEIYKSACCGRCPGNAGSLR